MTTAREAFEAKKLAEKYGVIGKVAGRYREAGYQVEVVAADEDSAYNFTAERRGERLAVKVAVKPGPVPVEVLEKLAGQAGEHGYKPMLVLYGSGPRLVKATATRAAELKVSVRRARF